MSTIADLIEQVRIEIDDDTSSRWTEDATLVSLIAKAVRRSSHVLRREEIPFARSYGTITTTDGTHAYDLPNDFMTVEGLYRDATHKEVIQVSDRAFESITSAGPCEAYCIRNGQILLSGTPSSAETLTLIYYPLIDTSGYTTATTMPWDGKLDDPIAEYAAIRCKNIDEMNFTLDAQLLTDLEKNILDTYGNLNPMISSMKGWM